MRNRPLIVIFVTVFIDLIGFGMIIPLNPYLAREFGADPLRVGLLMTIFSLMQFLFSPFWGALSDRIGRRPIILVSLLGSALSHTWFAFAGSYLTLFLARMLAGLFGANISTAMAYIADVTKPEERSKGMGLIGAAFGLGFLMGPFLGGILGEVGSHLGSTPPLGPSFAAIGAGFICFVNFVAAIFVLKETNTAHVRRERQGRLQMLAHHLTNPKVNVLMIGFFLLTFGMANMEASLFMFVQDQFQWSLARASFGFAYVGLVMVFTQGYLIRKLMPKYGEKYLLSMGLILCVFGFLGIGLSHSIPLLACSVTLLGLGSGFATPSFSGLISILTPSEKQGETMGVTQSLSALGRILGPALGGWAYGYFGRPSPFLLAAALSGSALMLVLWIRSRIQTPHRSAQQPKKAAKMPQNMADDEEVLIDVFQLQSLMQNGVPFLFVSLVKKQPEDPRVQYVLSQAKEWDEKKPDDLMTPILIICDNGRESLRLAKQFASEGYKNAYAVRGGVPSLKEF